MVTASDVTLILDGVIINAPKEKNAITINDACAVTIELKAKSTNTLTGGNGKDGTNANNDGIATNGGNGLQYGTGILTINGKGTLTVVGGKGGNAIELLDDEHAAANTGDTGGTGGCGISGTSGALTINSDVTINGGTGGIGGGTNISGFYGGAGGAGGCGISITGKVTFNSSNAITATGGIGGKGGDGARSTTDVVQAGGNGGAGGDGVKSSNADVFTSLSSAKGGNGGDGGDCGFNDILGSKGAIATNNKGGVGGVGASKEIVAEKIPGFGSGSGWTAENTTPIDKGFIGNNLGDLIADSTVKMDENGTSVAVGGKLDGNGGLIVGKGDISLALDTDKNLSAELRDHNAYAKALEELKRLYDDYDNLTLEQFMKIMWINVENGKASDYLTKAADLKKLLDDKIKKADGNRAKAMEDTYNVYMENGLYDAKEMDPAKYKDMTLEQYKQSEKGKKETAIWNKRGTLFSDINSSGTIFDKTLKVDADNAIKFTEGVWGTLGNANSNTQLKIGISSGIKPLIGGKGGNKLDWTKGDIISAWDNYQKQGAAEGVNPSNAFDSNEYYAAKAIELGVTTETVTAITNTVAAGGVITGGIKKAESENELFNVNERGAAGYEVVKMSLCAAGYGDKGGLGSLWGDVASGLEVKKVTTVTVFPIAAKAISAVAVGDTSIKADVISVGGDKKFKGLSAPFMRKSTTVQSAPIIEKLADALISTTYKGITTYSNTLPKYNGDTAIQNSAGAYGVAFSITDETGKQITDFGGETVTLGIPFQKDAAMNSSKLMAVLVDKDGKMTAIPNSFYSEKEQKVIVPATTSGVYLVVYAKDAQTFTDTNNHWAKDDIDFVTARGMIGSNGKKFYPNAIISRGEFVDALSYIAQKDVSEIIDGGRNFGMTRQEVADILMQFSLVTDIKFKKARAEIKFTDTNSKSAKTMQMAGIMMPKDGNKFDPKGIITKGETSAILRRMVELMADRSTTYGLDKNDSGKFVYYAGGDLFKGEKTINGKTYHFGKDGICTKVTKPTAK